MITLEISGTEIRLMEVVGEKVVKWGSRALDPDIFEEGVLSNLPALGVAVKELMASSGVSDRDVTLGVSGLYSLSRLVMVPNPLGGPTNQQMVMEAAQSVMPLSEEELYLHWQVMATVEGSGQQVLVVGVPRDVIDSQIQALRTVGLNPRVVDLRAMALIRAVNKEQALILNINTDTYETILVAAGITEVMHTTAWRPDELSLEDRAEQLALVIELTVGFYNSSHPGFTFDSATPLFITGPMSRDLALVEKVQARVIYQLGVLEPALEYAEHLPVAQYATNIGLALKGAASAKGLGESGYPLPDINLLPQIYRPWKPSVRQIYIIVAVLAAIALIFPLYQVTLEAMGETAKLETRYNLINTELERRQLEIKNRDPLQKAINEYNTIVDKGGGFTEALRFIRSRADALGVEVQEITHEGGSIKVKCQADSYLAFREYVAALGESGQFSVSAIPSEVYPYIQGGTITLEPKTGE